MRRLLNTVRGVMARNWTLKLSALGIALLLWFSVRFEARNQQELPSVAVRLDLTDPGWVLANGTNPGSVSVRFRGPAVELVRLSTDRPVVVVPISEVGSSDTTVVIQPGWVRFGERPGVTVEAIQPGSLRLQFEPIQRLTLPPALRFEGELPGDLALAAPPRATVGELRVSGPRSRMASLDSIPLRPVDLSAVRQSGAIPVLVDTARVRGVEVQPLALEVELRVEPRMERSLFLDAPPLPAPLEAVEVVGYPLVIPVTFQGAISLIEALSPGQVRLEAELADDVDPAAEEGIMVSFRVIGVPAWIDVRVDPVRVVPRPPVAPPEPDTTSGGPPPGIDGNAGGDPRAGPRP